MENALEVRVALLERDVGYLKDGHNEMKETIKELKELPMQINSINHKLDAVLDNQKERKEEVKEAIKELEERIDCIEETPPAVLPVVNNLDPDKWNNNLKLLLLIVGTIMSIAAVLTGNPIPPIGVGQ